MATGFIERFKGKIKAHVILVGNGGICPSVAAGLSAAGTTRADALQLAAPINQLTTVTSGQGVVLPRAFYPGQSCDIYNDDSADAVQVYALGSDTIDGVAGATGVPLAHAKRCRYTAMAVSAAGVATWESAQLGAVSA